MTYATEVSLRLSYSAQRGTKVSSGISIGKERYLALQFVVQ